MRLTDGGSGVDTEHADAACRQAVRGLIARYGWSAVAERELVARVVGAMPNGSGESLERLAIGQYAQALYALCRTPSEAANGAYTDLFRYLWHNAARRWPDHAEEIAQRALVLVFEQIERCRHPSAFLAFALAKLLQAHSDLLRTHGRELPSDRIDEQVDTAAQESQPSIDERLVQREGQELLLAALRELPYRLQQTIVLKYYVGWSDGAIAEHLGITPGHVRVLRFRALEQLRSRLHHYFGQAISPDSL